MPKSGRTSLSVKPLTVERLRPFLGRLGVSYDAVLNSILDSYDLLHPKVAPQAAPEVPA